MDKNKKIEFVASLLGWTVERAAESCIEKPELNALYFFDASKGGVSLLVAEDGSVLYANSSVTPDEHEEAFLNGIRTPIEAFDFNKKA